MATRALHPIDPEQPLSYEEAAKRLSREERFMATVYAMNTLLIEKRVYTTPEFTAAFSEWANKQLRRSRRERIGRHPD